MNETSFGGSWFAGSGAGELSISGMQTRASVIGGREAPEIGSCKAAGPNAEEKEEMFTCFLETHMIAMGMVLGWFVHPVFFIWPVLVFLLSKVHRNKGD